MTKIVHFNPEITTVGVLTTPFDQNDVRKEEMLFSMDAHLASRHVKAPITQAILRAIADSGDARDLTEGRNWIVDTRVTMTMAGQYPSIPGWHCDDVPRGANGQPDFDLIEKEKPPVRHWLCLVSGETPATDRDECISGTEFVTSADDYPIDPERVWNSLNTAVESDSFRKTRFVKEREIIAFNQLAIHRASPARRNGWRLFFRLSLTHRKPANEIRNQVQVYVDPANAGW